MAAAGGDALPRMVSGGLERARVADIQRARVLAAMFEVVAERGVANVSVASVVALAGVSRRTFYEVFAAREGCFLAAFNEAARCAAERMRLALADAGPCWRDRVRAAVTALLRFLDEEPNMGWLLVVEALAAGPNALRRRQQMLGEAVAAVERGREEAKPGLEPAPLAAEGVVGSVFSVIHSRMLEDRRRSLLDLAGPLTGMIVMPYLGPAAARCEAERPAPEPTPEPDALATSDPLRHLEMRLTYRTVRVLLAIAANPHASNRCIADAADVADAGQMSKLLVRLRHLGLVENRGHSGKRGGPNAWSLTATGHKVHESIHAQTAVETAVGEIGDERSLR